MLENTKDGHINLCPFFVFSRGFRLFIVLVVEAAGVVDFACVVEVVLDRGGD